MGGLNTVSSILYELNMSKQTKKYCKESSISSKLVFWCVTKSMYLIKEIQSIELTLYLLIFEIFDVYFRYSLHARLQSYHMT